MSPTKQSGLHRDAASTIPTRTPSKPKKERKRKAKEPAMSPQEMFDARKEALTQEKRAEGNAVAHRHEIMLHEMFHLKERTLLLDYDPEVARNNKSESFLKYKAEHDLMILSSTDETLSRRTRRAHNKFSEFIKGSSTSQSQHTSTVSPELPPTSTISSKRKGKQKATTAELESSDVPTASAISAPAPRKGRKAITNSVADISTETISSAQPTLDPSESVSTQSHYRVTRSSRRRAGPSTTTLPGTPNLPPGPRKVILRVAQPESTLDRLLQKSSEPSLSSFIGLDGKTDVSLSKLEAEAKATAALAEKRAEFRRNGWYLPLDRNGKRRREPPEEPGRLVDTWDIILKAIEVTYRPDPMYLAVTKHICDAIKARAELSLYGQVVQGRLVRGTAKAKGSKKQRDDPETAWRKKLAKETLELVVDQWKRVVLASFIIVFRTVRAHAFEFFKFVREKRRAEEEEEERRRGQEHLDAILDQSRNILQSQHVNLSRAAGKPLAEAGTRSQSRLTRGDPDDDSDHEAEEEGQAAEVEGSSDEDKEGHEEGTMALLGGSGPSSPPETDVDQERPTVHSRHTSPDDVDQFPATPSSLDTMDVDNLLRLSDSVGDGIPMDLQPPDPIKELVTSVSSPAEIPPESSEPDYHEPDLMPARPSTPPMEDGVDEEAMIQDDGIECYLRPYAVTKVNGWGPDKPVESSPLLRGSLRPYQLAGLKWLANHHTQLFNCILSDEMGLGKTIQTIALLAHLASDRGVWGPHLVIVPTSVILNWEMEFKKFLPGFKVLSYYGNPKRRKELRKGWNDKYCFNVCITSYALAVKDAAMLRRKQWYYMILDEAHMIKNFKSQRWMTLAVIKSFRRLLLTGTPLQNNLTELFALLQFIMSGMDFAGFKEFEGLLSAPLEKAVELGEHENEENQQRVTKLHQLLRPFLLRRLKRDVEKDLPNKYEHLEPCPLSKRQRFLYDEFMARADTRKDLRSGNYHRIANILMQLRKVCNHPNLFEVRPVVTSFAMGRSVIADYEVKELLVRQRLLSTFDDDDGEVNFDLLGLVFTHRQDTSEIAACRRGSLAKFLDFPSRCEAPGEPPLRDTRTFEGYKLWRQFQLRHATWMRWNQIGYVNGLKCSHVPVYSRELLSIAAKIHKPILPLSEINLGKSYWHTSITIHSAIMSYTERARAVAPIVEKFAFSTPVSVAMDMPTHALRGYEDQLRGAIPGTEFDAPLHHASVKLRIAFPDPLLLQYDCGKLQRLALLLRERKGGGHRVLIFTQMTKILDILELFLNFHGYIYLRLDGATKIEDRQYITERFNLDQRVFCFISSSRSGGVGINLTGADTVIFYDSDFNPQMDKQCEDRAHRIGQSRDVHIYRFISEHTVEEALLRKANQKRSLDEIVIQKGEFDWRSLFDSEQAMARALEGMEDVDDAHAAQVATREAREMEGLDDLDFGYEPHEEPELEGGQEEGDGEGEEEEEGEGETAQDYMLRFVESDGDFFSEWRI